MNRVFDNEAIFQKIYFVYNGEILVYVNFEYTCDSVAVSKARIVGERDVRVQAGSDINLTCKAKDSPEPPQSVVWYR